MKKKKKKIQKKKKDNFKKKKIEKGLKPAEELFCQLYTCSGEFFNNATWCYIKAYDVDLPLSIAFSSLNNRQKKSYNVAKQSAYKLLTKIDIIAKCNEIMDSRIDNEVVDRELSWTISQRKDLASKVAAVREYNSLKARIQKPKEGDPNSVVVYGDIIIKNPDGSSITYGTKNRDKATGN